jgi:tryptophan-rich sensory protein
VFGAVWTILYGLLGYGLAMSIGHEWPDAIRDMLALFFLNVLWTPVFLRGRVTAALVLILVMIMQGVWAIDHTPELAPFITPYILWLAFAAFLNAEYVRRAYEGTLVSTT